MKKNSFVILSLIFCCLLLFSTSCTLKEITPTSYGSWDGNYIYRGNGKCKTTGEDYQTLVNSLLIDGVEFEVTDCVDYLISKDDIYMLLECNADNSVTLDEQNSSTAIKVIVKYNVTNKTQSLIWVVNVVEEQDYSYVYRLAEIFNDRIILQITVSGWDYYEHEYYSIAFNGEVLSYEEDYSEDWARVSKNYVVAKIYNHETNSNELYYRTNEFSAPIFMYGSADYYEWYYVSKDGVEGILIKNESYNSETLKYTTKNLIFYCFQTKTISSPLVISKVAELYGDYGFVKLYDRTTHTYRKFSSGRYYNATVNVEADNKLYEIKYSQNGISLQEMLDFTDNRNVLVYGVTKDMILYGEKEYHDAFGCSDGGPETKLYNYDVTLGKRSNISNNDLEGPIKLEDEIAFHYEKNSGYTFGNYLYFIHTEEVFGGFWVGNVPFYHLKRINLQTNQIETMQFLPESANFVDEDGVLNYCKELWGDDKDKKQFIIFNS